MTRYVLIQSGQNDEQLVPETPLPLEADLHDALTKHPELLPAEDLGLGRAVVVGREAPFASGYADLILIDEHGQICLVEVKKEGNPDTRRVLAQLIDYAAHLWGTTVEHFERTILHPYLRADGAGTAPSFGEFLFSAFDTEDGGDDPDLVPDSATAAAAADRLATGQFILVVAAPEISEGVQRAIAYLNAQGLRVYGLEVSYFAGAAKAFVPRVVAKPPVAATIVNSPRQWDETSVLQDLAVRTDSRQLAAAQKIFEWAKEHRLRQWFGKGRIDGTFMPGLDDETGYLFPFSLTSNGFVHLQFGAMARFPQKPFDDEAKRQELRERLEKIPGVIVPVERLDKFPNFSLAHLADDQALKRFLDTMEWAFAQARDARAAGFGRPV